METSIENKLRTQARHWLVTGVAGFIGSHLLEALLKNDQNVVGVDNFSTGHRANLEDVHLKVSYQQWGRFQFMEGDIRDFAFCQRAVAGVDIVLHQAALGSVPRSLADPIATNSVNVDGFLNVLTASKEAKIRRFVYASSSSVYGNNPKLPKSETDIGEALSPYAVSKQTDELYANVFSRCYGIACIGMRYFNVFGPRQDPEGPYAAVIPRWINAMLSSQAAVIYGDGLTSRDFCYVANVVQANFRAALIENQAALNQVYNVALDDRTSLNTLHELIKNGLRKLYPALTIPEVLREAPRAGDIPHSQADISKAKRLLNFQPTHDVIHGLRETLPCYGSNLNTNVNRKGQL